jgi:hypothetical protein
VADDRYCQAEFERLAKESPRELASMLSAKEIPTSRLTYAAEMLGQYATSEIAEIPLLGMLEHWSPLVREGAVLGLSYHLSARVLKALGVVAAKDSSSGVRAAAIEAINP